MGQAKIVSNLGDGAYTVTILKDVDRINAAKERCAQGIEAANAAQTRAEQTETAVKAEIEALGEQLEVAITAAAGNAQDAAVLALVKKQNDAANRLQAARHGIAQAKLKRLSLEKESATYDGVTAEEQADLWCADATDDLAAGTTVGTIEINQESTQMLVSPGGEASQTMLQPGLANDALATYYNWATLPGVQRWKPTYRVGTIKEVDYDADTAMVCLDDARSSAQNIKINPPGVECETQKDGPQGFVAFCERNPEHEACKSNGSTTLAYSSDLLAQLSEINQRINAANTYAYDSDQYGKLEDWEEMPQSGGRGDCEDFALAKYRACLNAGIPASALRLATGRTRNGQGHAWLEVQTDQGNVALDLNTQAATLSDALPYSNRTVQADGVNWSGKGLLLEDVPVEYMECNAAAFKADDRVVVHFRDSDWSKPRVIGFEEQPQRCGDIVCIYWKDDAYRASRLTFTERGAVESVDVKAGTPVLATEYQAVPMEFVLGAYMRTMSRKIKIGTKEFYLFASPATEGFIFGGALDYMYNKSSKINGRYFSIYDPDTGKLKVIPIDSYGVFNTYSAWNYANGRFYCNKVVANENNVGLIVDIIFQYIDVSLDADGEIVFGDVHAVTVNNESLNAEMQRYMNEFDCGFVSAGGVFKFLWMPHEGGRAYGNLQGAGTGYYTVDAKTGAVNFSLDGGVSNGPVFTCVDADSDGLDYHNGTRTRDGYDHRVQFGGKSFQWTSDVSEGSPGSGVWTHVDAYCKTLRIPIGDASELDKQSFYCYYTTTTMRVLGVGTLISVETSNKLLCTPYGDIEINTQLDGTIDVYGMAHIERPTGDKFQAVAVLGSAGGAGFYAWHNGVRVDTQIAEGLGVSPEKIIGFIHRPRS